MHGAWFSLQLAHFGCTPSHLTFLALQDRHALWTLSLFLPGLYGGSLRLSSRGIGTLEDDPEAEGGPDCWVDMRLEISSSSRLYSSHEAAAVTKAALEIGKRA